MKNNNYSLFFKKKKRKKEKNKTGGARAKGVVELPPMAMGVVWLPSLGEFRSNLTTPKVMGWFHHSFWMNLGLVRPSSLTKSKGGRTTPNGPRGIMRIMCMLSKKNKKLFSVSTFLLVLNCCSIKEIMGYIIILSHQGQRSPPEKLLEREVHKHGGET
jgi:hypothetical protein